jgi:hypothetical protein
VKSLVQRILLVLLLLCGKSYSVCYDVAGNSVICPSTSSVFTDGHSHDSCPCPCGEDDCEEHEVAPEMLPSHSVQVPNPTSLPVSTDDRSWLDAEIDLSATAHANAFRPARDKPDPTSGLRHAMLTGVVMLV